MTLRQWCQHLHLYETVKAIQANNKMLVLQIETGKTKFKNMSDELDQWKAECRARATGTEKEMIDKHASLIKETPRLKIKCFVVSVRHPSDLFQPKFPTISNLPTRAYHTCPLLFHPFQIQLRK